MWTSGSASTIYRGHTRVGTAVSDIVLPITDYLAMAKARYNTKAHRLILAVTLSLVGAFSFFIVHPFIWFLASIGVGLILGHWRALFLAITPWLIGIGVPLFIGHHFFFTEAWWYGAIVTVSSGLLGIAIGLLAHRVISVSKSFRPS